MEVDVETFDFDFRGNTQAHDHVDHLQNDEGNDSAVEEHSGNIDRLIEHLRAIAVSQPAFAGRVDGVLGEGAGEKGAERAAHTMHAPGVQAVVIANGLLHPDCRDVADHASGNADDERAHRIDKARSRGDRHKTGNRTRDHAQDRRLLGDDPFGEHPGQRRGSRRDLRRGGSHAGIVAGGDSRTGVKAEPANPQERGADDAEHQIVRRHIVGAQANALAQDKAGHQSRRTGVQMHHRTAGIVERASALGDQEARTRAEPAATPHPMGDGAIDQDQPQTHEPQEGAELHAISQGARNERRGNDREGHLEEHIDRFRNGTGQAGHRVQAHRFQEQVGEAADPGIHARVRIGREGDGVADDHPQDGDQAGCAKALRQRRQHILFAHHAAIEQSQARNGHHQHQRR